MTQKVFHYDIRTPCKTTLLVDDTTIFEILHIVLFLIQVVLHTSHGLVFAVFSIIHTHHISFVSWYFTASINRNYQSIAHLEVGFGSFHYEKLQLLCGFNGKTGI